MEACRGGVEATEVCGGVWVYQRGGVGRCGSLWGGVECRGSMRGVVGMCAGGLERCGSAGGGGAASRDVEACAEAQMFDV